MEGELMSTYGLVPLTHAGKKSSWFLLAVAESVWQRRERCTSRSCQGNADLLGVFPFPTERRQALVLKEVAALGEERHGSGEGMCPRSRAEQRAGGDAGSFAGRSAVCPGGAPPPPRAAEPGEELPQVSSWWTWPGFLQDLEHLKGQRGDRWAGVLLRSLKA